MTLDGILSILQFDNQDQVAAKKKAREGIRDLIKAEIELWRDEEYIPIDELLAQVEKL